MKFNMQGKLNFRFGKQNSRLSTQPSPLLSLLSYGGPWPLLASLQLIVLWYLLQTLFLVSKPVSSPSCWGQYHILTLPTNSVIMPGLCSLRVGFFSQTLGDGSGRKQSSLDSCSELAYHRDLYLPVQVSHAGLLSISCLTLPPCLAPCPSISPLNLEWSLVRWAKSDMARPQWATVHPKTVSVTPTGVLWAGSWHLWIRFPAAPCSTLTRGHIFCTPPGCVPEHSADLRVSEQHLSNHKQFSFQDSSTLGTSFTSLMRRLLYFDSSSFWCEQ